MVPRKPSFTHGAKREAYRQRPLPGRGFARRSGKDDDGARQVRLHHLIDASSSSFVFFVFAALRCVPYDR